LIATWSPSWTLKHLGEIQTAARIAKLVFDSGLARVKPPADMVAFIRQHVYRPEYKKEAASAAA
jgi:malate dehydrogenase (oxaloacetate-decarboxylating)(NADP+)